MVSYFVETGSHLEPWLAYKSLDQASLQLSEVYLSLPHEYWMKGAYHHTGPHNSYTRLGWLRQLYVWVKSLLVNI